jgi:hypothetical protein
LLPLPLFFSLPASQILNERRGGREAEKNRRKRGKKERRKRGEEEGGKE